MAPSNYRKLLVWQKSRELAKLVYRTTKSFPKSETFGLSSQMQRAAISILSNLAEGDGRPSTRDRQRFQTIARGSAMELEAQIVIAADLDYISRDLAKELEFRSIEITRMLSGMLRQTN
ncbi:MAG TPA: four helix bundle protein [Thermoanaerobaculia bacterium]|nr:four helix bundle protein [Thermoanaerobaculia bacterium]